MSRHQVVIVELDHPPVDVLRLGARAAALCGVFAGAVRIAYTALPLSLTLNSLLWALMAGIFVSAVVVGLLVRPLEGYAGATLATTAALATLYSGGIQMGALLGWKYGFALLFLASGLFWLSAWAWTRREEALRPVATSADEPEAIRG